MLPNASPECLNTTRRNVILPCMFNQLDYKCQVETLEQDFLENVLILKGIHYLTTLTELVGNRFFTSSHVNWNR